MSSNKKIKEAMIRKYGAKCMMEEAGIRYIPAEKRRRITGYKKSDEVLTYHHLKPKSKGRTSNRRKWSNNKKLQSSMVRE